MRCPHLATVVNLPIAIRVTLSTRRQRAGRRTKLHTSMFSMTINATNASGCVRLDHCRGERFSVMTRRTALFHAARQRMTVRTRAGVWLSRDRGDDAELRQRVRLRDRRGRKRACVPVSGRNRH